MIFTAFSIYKSLSDLNEQFLQNKSLKDDFILLSTSREVDLPDRFKLILRFLPSSVFSVAIHGSRASNDNIAFSDLDDLVLVKGYLNTVVKIYCALVLALLESVMQFIDPEQHHGHWLLSVGAQRYQEGAYLPFATLEKAVHVYGKNQYVKQGVNLENKLFYQEALIHTERFVEESLAELHHKGLTIYSFKSLISAISLLPALRMQANGVDIDKKSAILIEIKRGNSQLEWASDIRLNWSYYIARYRGFWAYLSFLDPYLFRKIQMKIGKKVRTCIP